MHDNGVGFDMAKVDQLFKPFTRLHQSGHPGGLTLTGSSVMTLSQ